MTIQIQTPSEPQPVVHADVMTDENFARHMSLRHQDSLGGLSHIQPFPAVIPSWRAFHRRLHALRIDMQHEHTS